MTELCPHDNGKVGFVECVVAIGAFAVPLCLMVKLFSMNERKGRE